MSCAKSSRTFSSSSSLISPFPSGRRRSRSRGQTRAGSRAPRRLRRSGNRRVFGLVVFGFVHASSPGKCSSRSSAAASTAAVMFRARPLFDGDEGAAVHLVKVAVGKFVTAFGLFVFARVVGEVPVGVRLPTVLLDKSVFRQGVRLGGTPVTFALDLAFSTLCYFGIKGAAELSKWGSVNKETAMASGTTAGTGAAQARQERDEAQARFQITFDANPAPSVIVRLADQRVLEANPGLPEITGRP